MWICTVIVYVQANVPDRGDAPSGKMKKLYTGKIGLHWDHYTGIIASSNIKDSLVINSYIIQYQQGDHLPANLFLGN